MANAHPMVPLVLRNLLPLLRDVDTVQFALDVAHARMRDNAARLAMLVPLLARARRLAPAGVDAEAAELMDQLEEAVVGALEARLQLVQVVTLLVVVRAVATARRRARRLPSVLLAVAALAFAVSGSGVALGPLRVFVMVSTVLLLVLSWELWCVQNAWLWCVQELRFVWISASFSTVPIAVLSNGASCRSARARRERRTAVAEAACEHDGRRSGVEQRRGGGGRRSSAWRPVGSSGGGGGCGGGSPLAAGMVVVGVDVPRAHYSRRDPLLLVSVVVSLVPAGSCHGAVAGVLLLLRRRIDGVLRFSLPASSAASSMSGS
uniref:Uncharacterized protein n=1 Tax=Oryza glumipatula TaxID=40148 RepID=A0A0D9YDM2_9ORYZ